VFINDIEAKSQFLSFSQLPSSSRARACVARENIAWNALKIRNDSVVVIQKLYINLILFGAGNTCPRAASTCVFQLFAD